MFANLNKIDFVKVSKKRRVIVASSQFVTVRYGAK